MESQDNKKSDEFLMLVPSYSSFCQQKSDNEQEKISNENLYSNKSQNDFKEKQSQQKMNNLENSDHIPKSDSKIQEVFQTNK